MYKEGLKFSYYIVIVIKKNDRSMFDYIIIKLLK